MAGHDESCKRCRPAKLGERLGCGAAVTVMQQHEQFSSVLCDFLSEPTFGASVHPLLVVDPSSEAC
jgi:hypothetical protein